MAAAAPAYTLIAYNVPVQVGLTDDEKPLPVTEPRQHTRVVCQDCHWSTVLVVGVDELTVEQVQASHNEHHEAMTPEAWAEFRRQEAEALEAAQRRR